jgi:hypothetical protein
VNTNPLSTSKHSDVSREMNHAFEKFFDPNLERALRRRAASEDGYGAYDVSMQAGYADEYRSLFDFFVHLHGIDKLRGQKSFVWETMPNRTIEQFLEFRSSEMHTLLQLAGAQEQIREGYVVFEDRGQLDEITTWSRTRWLFATERSFVYIDYYATVIH